MSKEKNSILIYYSKLNIGGAERSNLKLMQYLVNRDWDVTLLLRYGGGTLETAIPKNIKVIHLYDECFTSRINQEKGKFSKAIRAIRYMVPILKQRRDAGAILKKLQQQQYDIAVVGLQGLNPKLVLRDIKAVKRALWIRNDLKLCDKDGRVHRNINRFGESIDYFPCVSLTAYNSLVEAFPKFKDKAVVFYNIINADEMREKAVAFVPQEMSGYEKALRVITVCRVADKAKGIFRMISVYEKLRQEGYFFYWFLIGDGPDFAEAQHLIQEKKLDDGFILLGAKENPFPYYKQCDLSATLSYYEGLCGTVNEAKIMGLPVIATEFSGIHEQIENGVNGWIVDNQEMAILNQMKELLDDRGLIEQVKNDFLPESIQNDDKKEQLLLEMLKGVEK